MGEQTLNSSNNPLVNDDSVTVVKLSKLPKEALGRTLVVLEPGFIQARYDQDSFAKIASRKRQVSFGVTLVFKKESVLKLPQVKAVLEGEETMAVVCPSIPPSSTSVRFVTAYTDVLPPRIALYLDPDVPDEFGEKARRLEELSKAVSEMKRQGLRIPPAMKAELEELKRIVWTKAKIFKKPMNMSGYLKITVPTPNGMSTLSLRVESGNQSLAHMIDGLHLYLRWNFGVLKDFENAARLRDAIVQARAEGSGEAQLRARLTVMKMRGNFVVEPYTNPVCHKEGEDVTEYLEFLNRLMGGSFSVEAAERKEKGRKKFVAFQGFITIRATFHPDTES
jgi:hypothetical protein